ncbi:MAG: Ig-like domain-containing protein [Phycisphaerae bacterium]|nr:Ig-like domain-containing protein [Phycisphaerae bacterium]
MKRILLAAFSGLLLAACTSATGVARKGVIVREPAGPPPRMTIGARHTALQVSHLGQRHPAVAYGDGVYLLVWQEGWNGAGGRSEILGVRLDKDGKLLDKKPLAIAVGRSLREAPAVAFCNGQFLVAWADAHSGSGDYDIQSCLVSTGGAVSGEGVIACGGACNQLNPAIATDGKGQVLVVWQEYHTDHFEIRGKVYAVQKGAMTYQANVEVADRGELPSAAWTGSEYLVARRGGYATLIGPDGKVKVPSTQPWVDKVISSGVTAAAAWGKAYVFVNSVPFPDPWGWSGNGAIVGATLLPDGATPEIGIAAPYWHIKGKWLNDGSLVDKFGSAKADGLMPNVLDAARWFNHPGWPMGIRGALKHTMNDQWPSGTPAACYNGRSLLVVWPKAHLVDTRRLDHRQLYMTRVLPDWGVVDRPAVKIVSEPGEVTSPVLCAGPIGGALLAYERVSDEGPVVDYRILTEAEDREGPKIEYVVPMSDTQLVVRFNEPIDAANPGAGDIHFQLWRWGKPLAPPGPRAADRAGVREEMGAASINPDGRSSGRELIVTAKSALKVGHPYELKIAGLKDRSPLGNTAAEEGFNFIAPPGTMLRTDYIDRWCVVGPFPRDVKNHPFDPAATEPKPGDAAGKFKWELAKSQVVDLGEKYGEAGNQMAYAAVWAYSDRARKVILRIDTNDHNRAWLNGQLVNDDITGATGSRGFHESADEAPVKLAAGWNRLMLQVENQTTTWVMIAQLTDATGEPIRDLTWQAEKP